MNNSWNIRKDRQTGKLIRGHLPALAFKGSLLVLLLLVSMTGTVSANPPAPSMNASDCEPSTYCDYIRQITRRMNFESAVMTQEASLPVWFAPQLVVKITTPLISGPGDEFTSYGLLPVGFVSKIIGVSQDENWWAIEEPQSVAPDGMGWIDAEYVETANVRIFPPDQPGCDPVTYCGYIASLTYNVRVMQP